MALVPLTNTREVRHWLGLISYLEPQGLHGARRGNLMARHTRTSKRFAEASVYSGGTGRAVYIPVGRGVSLGKALAKTYPRNRETQVMSLLRAQVLDDRLWRWIYAVMINAGPLDVGEMIVFLARLTGSRKAADAHAARRYEQWLKSTHD